MASLTSNNKSIDELFKLLSETSRNSRCSRADRDAVLIAILKQQQETIEQNKKTIKEQKELIEHLWAWAEEKDDEEKEKDKYEEEDEDEGEEKEGEDDDDDFRDIASSFGTQYIDYTNFKLCDEYCGERVGFVYLKGIHGPGYYALKK
tara:strand:+ start:664 stop:1107 length:444 start_codon:yes stop_codon:yes gene_type:complete